jgi:hypothetical protein
MRYTGKVGYIWGIPLHSSFMCDNSKYGINFQAHNTKFILKYHLNIMFVACVFIVATYYKSPVVSSGLVLKVSTFWP